MRLDDRMGIKLIKAGKDLLGTMVVFAALPLSLMADIPAPGPREAEEQGADWTFVLMGAIFSFLSALVFLWVGRKLFKRS